jgi:hypothetical protein
MTDLDYTIAELEARGREAGRPTVRMLDVVLAALDVPVERRPLESFDLDTAILQKNQGGLS